MPNLALNCERTGVSNRNAALLVNAAFQDLGIITKEDKSKVVDKSKIHRERTKLRKKLNVEILLSNLSGLYFDSRKDKTLTEEKINSKYYKKQISEEHITLLQEPESQFLGHFTPYNASAHSLMTGICNYLEKSEIDMSSLGNIKIK